MDPGIVVRNVDPDAVQAEPSMEYDTGQSLKWCRTCHLYRSTGTKHCRWGLREGLLSLWPVRRGSCSWDPFSYGNGER